MKRILLGLTLLFAGFASFAQTKITEGTITYSLEFQLPDQMKPYAAFFPKEAIVYFKGDSTATVMKSTQGVTTVIYNAKKDFMKQLIERQGKQLVASFGPADLEEVMLALPEYTYTASTETETLGGYKGTKYSLKDKKGETMSVTFSKDIILPVNYMGMSFDPAYGTALAFSSAKGNGITITSVIKEVKAGPVPAGIFFVPKGFEPITVQQLKAMNGG